MIGNGKEQEIPPAQTLQPPPAIQGNAEGSFGLVTPSSSTPLSADVDKIKISPPPQTNVQYPFPSSAPPSAPFIPPSAPTRQIPTQQAPVSVDYHGKIEDIIEITYFAKAAIRYKGFRTYSGTIYWHSQLT